MGMNALPLPPHYDPAHAADWDYSPDQSDLLRLATEWRLEQGLTPAGSSPFDLHLLIVDAQKDFCFPKGNLYVAGRNGTGAIDDSRRTAEFIYRNLGAIKNITTTMDTHHAFQIFFPSFWVDGDGAPLEAHRVITSEDILAGEALPNPDMASWLSGGDYEWLRAEVLHYCRELEKAGKYTLYLWPPHCILGSEGHALVGAVHEARMFHSYARVVQSWVEQKGEDPLTENYSALRPEVRIRHDGRPAEEKESAFLRALLRSDALVIAGEAASHCVKSTVEDLLSEIMAHDPSLAEKVYILSDCMSAVVVPGADFTPQAEDALRRFAESGMHVVKSTDPIDGWPGISL